MKLHNVNDGRRTVFATTPRRLYAVARARIREARDICLSDPRGWPKGEREAFFVFVLEEAGAYRDMARTARRREAGAS